LHHRCISKFIDQCLVFHNAEAAINCPRLQSSALEPAAADEFFVL
jgi:hypothetical protein